MKRFHWLIRGIWGIKSNSHVTYNHWAVTRNYARSFSAAVIVLSFGSLIVGGQIVHSNEGKDKLSLFSTKGNVLLTPHPSYSSTINLFSFLFLISIHGHIDRKSTLRLSDCNSHACLTLFLRHHELTNQNVNEIPAQKRNKTSFYTTLLPC